MRPPESDCICPKAMQSLGRWEGVSMGKALLRTTTTEDCPVHDACHGYTKAVRAEEENGEWLYCPHHGKRNCP
jgi:hypothetical protein